MKTYTPELDVAALDRLRDYAARFAEDFPQSKPARWPEELVRRFAERFREQEWPGAKLPELYYDPRSLDREAAKRSSLHAKCVVVDRRVALVTSANFTEAAQTRNIEVGALIQSAWFATQLAVHFGALADAGVLKRCD
jgi:phosphatidylserine/phosphatidylglycerophosphate/cardiolipin synthase-like enzyme